MNDDHIISAIVAMSDNRVIGIRNTLPWKLPLDMKHFRELTLHHPILMGRKTYESIGKPLPKRQNFVLTRQKNLTIEGCIVINSFEEVLKQVAPGTEIFIIGGEEIYKLLLPLTNRIYITQVHATLFGDAFFPTLDERKWTESDRKEHPKYDDHDYAFSFVTLNCR